MNKLSKLYLSAGLTFGFLLTSALPVQAANFCADGKFSTLCGTKASLGGIVQMVINLVLFVGLAAALIFLILGGIKWIMSGGDKAQTETAKNAVTSALIGLAVVVGAYILVNVVLGFFNLGSLQDFTSPKLDANELNK